MFNNFNEWTVGYYTHQISKHSLGQHSAATVKQVEPNTLLSAEINCASVTDSPLIGSLQTSIVTSLLQVKKNNQTINLL